MALNVFLGLTAIYQECYEVIYWKGKWTGVNDNALGIREDRETMSQQGGDKLGNLLHSLQAKSKERGGTGMMSPPRVEMAEPSKDGEQRPEHNTVVTA